MISNLRIAGVIIGIIGLIATFLIYRGPNWKRLNFVLFALFNLCLIAISINPNLLNAVRDALSLQNTARGRILALLVISNIFLLFYIFYTKSKVEKFSFQFDQLVRNLGSNFISRDTKPVSSIKPIMILIPAYNEAENLKELLPRIPKRIHENDVGVLIIDDGSEDETYFVAEKTDGVIAVKNLVNRGGGAALRLGYDILIKSKGHICVTMDADGQHLPEDIEKLVSPVLNDQYDIVIGSRIRGKREKDSLLRIAGVYIFSIIISLLLGKKITDPSSGFRAFKINTIDAIQLSEDQYHTSELIIEAVKKNLRIGEVPITIVKRRFGRSKKGKELIYALNFTKTILKTWWR
ncbi:MAG: glycosyltransferase family 2 protein [Deltaproteobacteria bacterium]|nr:glycosyltransferase family 2 protein [Deltaproteobacteria bacterium]